MKRSLAEIAAMASKAARGCGCPWGLAEEAGMLTRVAEAHGLAGVAALSASLARDTCCTQGGPPCDLAQAVAASDQGQCDAAPGVFGQAAALLAKNSQAGSFASREVAAADWDRLMALAQRTYVPETEASRVRGAGPADEKD